ncbi:hypothetical protein J5N97_029680 [Dioscorea zingiberensis]|uniref:MSP domain-containing protein n=1 Tax=Dioscorea zingiberensis TaxID=325984 RepID=A0A9D5BVU8_9LILI|nr:hypothetical protein J5N97_029680 [Dioscorea zingiberensis]
MAALLHLPAAPPPRLAVVASPRPSSFSSSKLSILRFPPLALSSSPFVRRSTTLIARASSEDGDGDGEVAEEVEALEDGTVEVEEEEEELQSSQGETEERPPRKPRIKLGDIMGILNKRAVEAAEQQRPVPDIRTGDVVEIKLEVPENRKRLSIYKGIVMSKQNAGIHTTIRIRRIIAGIGVEIVFPVYSPNIKEIKVGLDLASAATMGARGQLISVYPEELSFEFELGKPSYCNLKVVNNTEHHVAFKVKTTSPRKYFVRPNTSVVQPWDSCTITVTLQAQTEYPPDMRCNDKFLLQSTKVPPITDVDELQPDTFNKEGDKVIEELKLKVIYKVPTQLNDGNSEETGLTAAPRSSNQGSDSISVLRNSSIQEIQAVQRLKSERDATLQQNQQLQRELEMLRRRKSRRGSVGFSLTFTAFAGLVGLMVGFILNLALSSPAAA